MFLSCRYYKQLLLSSQKLHIRQFAAESIAFLIRKIRDKDGILDALFSSVVSDPCLIDGVGILLFETIKGVNQMFHSCAGEIVSLALRKLTTGQLKVVSKTILLQSLHEDMWRK